MKQIMGLFAGIVVGGLIGAALVIAFAPASGKKLREAVDHSYHATLDDARAAAAAKREALQADYQRKIKG